MESYHYEGTVDGLEIRIHLNKRVNILDDVSGTGKSLLMKKMESICISQGYTCVRLDYHQRGLPADEIEKLCEGKGIVLLDNADLYLTNDLYQKLVLSNSLFVIEMKDIDDLFIDDCSFYRIKFDENVLETKRV